MIGIELHTYPRTHTTQQPNNPTNTNPTPTPKQIETLPLEYDIDLLRTPKLIVDALGPAGSAAASTGVTMQAPGAAGSAGAGAAGGQRLGGGTGGGGGHNWGGGGGRVLGTS